MSVSVSVKEGEGEDKGDGERGAGPAFPSCIASFTRRSKTCVKGIVVSDIVMSWYRGIVVS